MIKAALFLLLFATVSFAQKPLLFMPCIMCDILDNDSSAKVLSNYAEYDGKEYVFDTEEHRDAFVREPNTWLTWYDEPEPDEIATLVPS